MANDKEVWRSIKFPVRLAQQIETLAKREQRSFSAQVRVIVEQEFSKAKDKAPA